MTETTQIEILQVGKDGKYSTKAKMPINRGDAQTSVMVPPDTQIEVAKTESGLKITVGDTVEQASVEDLPVRIRDVVVRLVGDES